MSFSQITPTDKFGWHAAYLPVYERLFKPFLELDSDQFHRAIRLLEIGTDGGGGLRMYQEYFPYAQITGVDISPIPDAVKDQPRIMHYQEDAYKQSTVALLEAVFHQFDILIDDGPHTLGSQMFFVQNYPHLLTPEGIAIVEDIQDPAHIAQLQSVLPPGFHSMAIDLRHVEPTRYDNLLFCVFR